MTSANPPYIPFQTLQKAKQYKILNYGRTYNKYTHYHIALNKEQITDIYVDNEPYTMCNADGSIPRIIDESKITYNVEIHYHPQSNKPLLITILTDREINRILATYGTIL